MNPHRLTAMLLILIAATTTAYMSQRSPVPVAVTVVAFVGAMQWLRLRLTRQRELIIMLVLAAAFALAYRASPYHGVRANGFFLYAFFYALGLYLLAVMGVKMLVAYPHGLPPTLPLYGAVVMICAGNVYADDVRARAYQVLALAFACATGLYFAAGRRGVGGTPAARLAGRRLLVVVALCIVVAGGATASALLFRYQQEMNRLLSELSLRFRSPRALSFSRTARLGSLRRIKASRSQRRIALRVLADDAPGYLRGLVFETYSGSAWEQGSEKVVRLPADDVPATLPEPPEGYNTFAILPAKSRRWDRYEVWPATHLTEAMFTPPDTAYLSADAPRLVVDESGAADAMDMTAGAPYTAAVCEQDQPPPTEAARNRYTALPPIDPRVRALARRLFEGRATARAKIQAVEEHFHTNYEYGLRIRVPRGEDPLTYFLLNRPAAHCEYFASGAAVLLRLGGVPARYVTGFVARERNDLGEYWLARNADAHAWVEAWDDRAGWTIVEATPPDGVPGGRSASMLAELWDYLKFRFHELRVMVFADGLRGLLRWIGRRLAGAGRWLIGTWTGRAVAAVLAALLAWLLARKLRPRRGRPRGDPLVAALHRLRDRLDRRVERRGLVRADGETLHQFSARLARAAAEAGRSKPNGLSAAARWYVRYAEARYAPARGAQAVERLRAALPDV